MKRRDFLKNSALGVGATMLPLSVMGNDSKEETNKSKEETNEAVEYAKRSTANDITVLIHSEHRRYFMMEPDETGRIKLNDLYAAVKKAWRYDSELIKYSLPMLAITPELYETINGWYIVNPDMLYGGSIHDTTKDEFYQSLIVLGETDNKWKAGHKVYKQRAIITNEPKDNISLLDANGREHPLKEMENALGWDFRRIDGRVYGNYYFPGV